MPPPPQPQRPRRHHCPPLRAALLSPPSASAVLRPPRRLSRLSAAPHSSVRPLVPVRRPARHRCLNALTSKKTATCDDGWMSLDVRKCHRTGTVDSRYVDPNRKLRHSRAFESRNEAFPLIHAVQVASLESKCVSVMGAQMEDVAIELQYPSLQPREKFELVWGKDKIDAVETSICVVRHVAETYLTEDDAKPFTNQGSGLIRRLEKASNRNIQDLAGFKAALHEYNETLLSLVEDGVIERNLDNMHELPCSLVAFILDQVYDHTVAPNVGLLSKYENGTDYVYGELLHPFISKVLVEQTRMTSDQGFVDLGSGVGNVCLQAALEIGCESWGCEVMENACSLAEAQKKEFSARCMLWGIKLGKVHLERGDFRKSAAIHEALKRAEVILVNNKAFTSQLNDDLVRMFLDLKSGCKIVSLSSFVADFKSSHNINDVGSTILDVEEHAYPQDFVSWTNAGGPYFISTRK